MKHTSRILKQRKNKTVKKGGFEKCPTFDLTKWSEDFKKQGALKNKYSTAFDINYTKTKQLIRIDFANKNSWDKLPTPLELHSFFNLLIKECVPINSNNQIGKNEKNVIKNFIYNSIESSMINKKVIKSVIIQYNGNNLIISLSFINNENIKEKSIAIVNKKIWNNLRQNLNGFLSESFDNDDDSVLKISIPSTISTISPSIVKSPSRKSPSRKSPSRKSTGYSKDKFETESPTTSYSKDKFESESPSYSKETFYNYSASKSKKTSKHRSTLKN